MRSHSSLLQIGMAAAASWTLGAGGVPNQSESVFWDAGTDSALGCACVAEQ